MRAADGRCGRRGTDRRLRDRQSSAVWRHLVFARVCKLAIQDYRLLSAVSNQDSPEWKLVNYEGELSNAGVASDWNAVVL